MQHSNFKQTLVKAFTFAALSLFTFNAKAGGDSYQIYLNNKLLLKQYVTQPLNVKSLQLDKANLNDRLVIFYSHCGQTGKGRSIAIKDEKGKIIKEWKFANSTGSNESMIIPVKELLQLEKNNLNGRLHLYYASQQLPKGRMLTSLNLGKSNVTYNHAKTNAGVTTLYGVLVVGLLYRINKYLLNIN
ncbi:MAG: hypothetical protein H0V14_06800 [Chitinophagaceae bacterium]|nr:hypothetical protein [Chitinophagaceae bacterium]